MINNSFDNKKVDHYQRCKQIILRYSKEGEFFRSLIGDHKIWWKTDREKGTAKLFYPDDENFNYLTGKYRTLYWTAQLFAPETAEIEKPYDFEQHRITEQIGGREDTVFHSFFLDFDKAKDKDIHDPETIKWLEIGIKFFADKLLNAGVKSFGLLFSGGGIYCILHPRLGMVPENEKDRENTIAIIQRAFDLFIGDVASEFFEKNPEAIGYVKFDKLNYDKKRQVKTILSIHKKYPYVVIPLDKENPRIDLEEATLPVRDETIERAKAWLTYCDDIDNFGKLLKPWMDKAKDTIKKTRGTRAVNLETEEVSQEHWPPCIKNLIAKKDLKSGEGATRALAVIASYLRYAGVSEEKAYNLFHRKASEWSAETSNIFTSWYGCVHLDKPVCFVPSCEKMRTKGSGYPHPELGELNICSPDERCKEIRSPIQYHKKREGTLHDTDYYLIFVEKNDGTRQYKGIRHKLFADDLIVVHHFKTLEDTDEVLYYKDGYYHYNGEAVIKAECERVLHTYLKTNDVNEIVDHVRRSTYINRERLNKDLWTLNLENGVLDIKTFAFSPHSPELFTTIRVPVEYNPDADCPNVKSFLSDILYERDIPTIEEIIGYCLLPDYRFQYWFLLHGEGENGKSTLLTLITTFLGPENVAAVGLQSLNLRFASMSLYGKLANVVADLSSQDLKTTHNLKALTGGDTIMAEPKFKNPFTFINHAKLIYSCNQIPLSDDKSRAFYRRVLFIPFPRTFEGKTADKYILGKITTKEELSGLLNLAIKALKRLLAQNDFTGSITADAMREKYERASNNVYGFFYDRCELEPSEHIGKAELFSAYCDYCEDIGVPPFSEKKFVENMKALTKMETARLGPKRNRKMVWLGLKLKEEEIHKKTVSSEQKIFPTSREDGEGSDDSGVTHDNDVNDIFTINTQREENIDNNNNIRVNRKKKVDTSDTVDTITTDLSKTLDPPEHPEPPPNIGKKYHREYRCPCGKSYHTKEKFDEHINDCGTYKSFLGKYTPEVVNGIINYLSGKEGYFNAEAIGEGIGNDNEQEKITEVCEALREQGFLSKSRRGDNYLYSYRRDIGEYTNSGRLLVFKCNECGFATTNAGAWGRHNVRYGHNSEEAVRQGRDEQANFINLGEGSKR